MNPSILKTERPPVTCARSNGYYGRPNAPDRPASALPRERVRSLAQTGGQRLGRAFPLCPGISDINLFRYCQRVINLNAKISDRAFDLGMPEQELDGPEITCPSIDQGRFCSSQGMRAEQPRVQPDASDPL